MVLKPKQLISSLTKKGFQEFEGGNHKKYIFFNGKVKTGIIVEISHDGKDIRKAMSGIIKREMKLDSNNQLQDFYNCPMTKEQYTQILIDKKLID
ncbi:MAG: type II toxin-antitoxin system HicA family toxin [Bacilli bacterium]|nr:type II toxin-antitoxin system HicA family toxin [Bacilli bacterium]